MDRLGSTLWVCGFVVLVPTMAAAREAAVNERALAFFAALPAGDVAEAVRARRPSPISLDERNRAIASLPRDGGLRPSADENVKLSRLTPILAFHQRTFVVTQVIDVAQAFVGLHARSVLLISRRALQLLSSAELQAIVAHEMGHDYFWEEYQRANERHDTRLSSEVELKCDGLAALTLIELGLSPRDLINAARKLTRFNEKLGAAANADAYPSPSERERFVLTVLALRPRSPYRSVPRPTSNPSAPGPPQAIFRRAVPA